MKKLSVLALGVLLVLSACAQNRPGQSDRPVASDRMVDLEGRGVITYKVKRPDIGDGGAEEGKMEGVKAIRFYESYVVVEKDGGAKIFSSDSLISFVWEK